MFALIKNGSEKKNRIIIKIIVFSASVAACALLLCSAFLNKEPYQAVISKNNEKINYNFLLLGVDKSERLSDVIMLVSLNTENGRVSIAQIPRDTYAEYTSAAYRKLNGAISSLGDGRAVADFFENIFNITIDYYITLDLDGLAEAVDLLGGIEVVVPEDMVYNDPYQNLEIKLKAGKQLLDGNKAKQFIRYRAGYVRGDLARLDAQKIFLSAFFKKLVSCNIPELIFAAQKLLSNSESNIQVSKCLDFVSCATKIKSGSMLLFTAPGSDIKTENGSWYYILNKKETHKMFCEYFGCEAELAEFDQKRMLTGNYSKNFNLIYDAEYGYECRIYTADSINSEGIEIDRIN